MLVAAVLLAGGVVIAVLGWNGRYDVDSIFFMDRERQPPAFFSGLLLAWCSAMAWRVGRRHPSQTARLWYALSAGLAFLALDEALAVHEFFERAAGLDWQVLYVPLISAGAWLAVKTFRTQARLAPWFLLAAAAVCWGVAFFLEYVQWRTGTRTNWDLIMPEETLELAGTWLIGVALLLAAWPLPRSAAVRARVRPARSGHSVAG